MLGCCASYFRISWPLHAELLAAIIAIEMAHPRGWLHLWLECDSQLVVLAFSNTDLVPWKLRNRWKNCLDLSSSMFFRVSYF